MITYRQVKLADTQAIVESFLRDQWAETGEPELFCKPNWGMYHALEKLDRLLLLIAYDDSLLLQSVPIGYIAGFLHPHVNAIDNLVATIPTYYVMERTARALILRTLFEQMISVAQSRGAVTVNIKTSWDHPCGRLLEKMGFRPVEIGYKLKMVAES